MGGTWGALDQLGGGGTFPIRSTYADDATGARWLHCIASLPVLVSINRLQFHDPQVFKCAYQNSASLAGGYPLAQEVKLWDSKLET